MRRHVPLAIFVVIGFAMAMVPNLRAQTPAEKPSKPLFIGKDTVTWLPKSASIPDAPEIEKKAEKLGSRARNVDPFGVPTFPTEEDALPEEEENSSRPTPKVTLNQALGTLKVNGVNLSRKAFLLGGRNVYEGDMIELAFRDQLFKALVMEVGASNIVFHDFDRKEDGVIPHSIVRQLELQPVPQADAPLKARMTPMEPFSPQKK